MAKVRGFQHILAIPGEGHSDNLAHGIEIQINRFLAENPKVQVRDVKLAAHAAEVTTPKAGTNYALFALLIYDE